MKRVYLDQNKWIELAQNYYKKNINDDSRELLNNLEEFVKRGKIIFPLSSIHIVEILKSENKERRERLSKFMYQLSQGNYLLPLHSVRGAEIQNAIIKKTGIDRLTNNIKEYAVSSPQSHSLYAFQ